MAQQHHVRRRERMPSQSWRKRARWHHRGLFLPSRRVGKMSPALRRFNSRRASAPLACSVAFDNEDILNREPFSQTGP